MTISMPARPPAPFKPLRMNVNRHYYIKTKKQEKINSHPPQKKKCVTSKNLTTKDKNERETALTFDRAALTSAAHWSVMNTRSKSFHGWIYFVLKKQCNSILLHRSVFNMLFSQRLPSQCCFSKMPVNPSTCPPHCPPLAQKKKKIREKTSKEAQIFTLADLNEVLPPPPPPPLRLSSWTNRMAGSF